MMPRIDLCVPGPAKLLSQVIDFACDAQSAKVRIYFRKLLISLGWLAKRKLPHTPYAHARNLMARACASRSANKEKQYDIRPD